MADQVKVRQDFLKDESYFSKWITFKEKTAIPEMVIQTKSPSANKKYRAQFIFTIFRERSELLIERYSRGDDLHDLRITLPEIIETWEWARQEELKVFNENEMANRHNFARNLDAYCLALWMVSITICLKADNDILQRMLKLIGNEGEDWLFEQLVARHAPGRKSTEQLLYPKPYQLLKDAIEETVQEDRNRLMEKFLKTWYPGMSKTYWHDCHKGPEGGGYFGYWCFEAAGVVRVFGIDDSAFRDNLYYPKDLAEFEKNDTL